jgi:hypothetical protein
VVEPVSGEDLKRNRFKLLVIMKVGLGVRYDTSFQNKIYCISTPGIVVPFRQSEGVTIHT